MYNYKLWFQWQVVENREGRGTKTAALKQHNPANDPADI